MDKSVQTDDTQGGGLLPWLGIPVLSATTVGLFRVVFGLALLAVIWIDPPSPQPLELHRNYSWLADWVWVHDIASSAAACRALHLITIGLAALFVVGLWTRSVYIALVLGVFASRLVELQQSGTHDWDLPLLTLAVLTVIPWGDGFSLDTRLGGRRSDRGPGVGRRYGLAIWIPGLMLGLALAAAAYAKLTYGGLAWITTGAVRYHFVEDAANAPVTWGLWVAAHPMVAVLLSLGVVLLEATFIANIFIGSPWWRLLAGAAGLSIFVGFYIFQGVIWWPWFMLFTAFLPWALLDRHAMPSAAGRLRPWHAAVVVALLVQQVLVSATATEVEPIISNYPMYAATYESPEEFEQVRYRKMQRLIFEADERDVTERVQAVQNASEDLLDVAEDLAAGSMPQEATVTALRGVREEYRTRFGTELKSLTVFAERVPFDWEQGVFKPPIRVRIAEVPLPAAVSESQ